MPGSIKTKRSFFFIECMGTRQMLLPALYGEALNWMSEIGQQSMVMVWRSTVCLCSLLAKYEAIIVTHFLGILYTMPNYKPANCKLLPRMTFLMNATYGGEHNSGTEPPVAVNERCVCSVLFSFNTEPDFDQRYTLFMTLHNFA